MWSTPLSDILSDPTRIYPHIYIPAGLSRQNGKVKRERETEVSQPRLFAPRGCPCERRHSDGNTLDETGDAVKMPHESWTGKDGRSSACITTTSPVSLLAWPESRLFPTRNSVAVAGSNFQSATTSEPERAQTKGKMIYRVADRDPAYQCRNRTYSIEGEKEGPDQTTSYCRRSILDSGRKTVGGRAAHYLGKKRCKTQESI